VKKAASLSLLALALLLAACGGGEPEEQRSLSVELSADPTQGQAPLPVNFEAVVPDADASVGYIWDFGTSETLRGSASRSYVFEEAGTYDVRVVAQTEETSAADTVRVTVTEPPEVPDNAAPEVELSASSITGQAPFEVKFKADASDPDGDALTYSWNFGDGTTVAGNSTEATHRYEAAGAYAATVTVTDEAGGVAKAELQIAVAPPENAPAPDPAEPPATPGEGENGAPSVTLTASAARGNAPLTVSFSAQASDPDGDDLSYAWTFGNGERATGNSSRTVTYEEPGEYTAWVVASDGLLDARASFTVRVREAPEEPAENTAPTVSVDATPREGRAPLEVTLTADAEDADGDDLTYLWDFGDGTIAGDNPATHVYEEGGSYTAIVSVSDRRGGVTQEEVEIEVADAPDSGEPPPPDVPFYGEWAWAARTSDGRVLEGFLSVSERTPEPEPEFADGFVEGGSGAWTYCADGVDECASPTGVGYIDIVNYGDGDEIDVVFVDTATGDPSLVAFDEDDEVGDEVEGAPTILGAGAWFNVDGSLDDVSFAMVKIGNEPTIATLEGTSAQLREALRHSSSR